MLLRSTLLILSLILIQNSFAQSRKRKSKEKEDQQSTTVEPFYPQQDFAPKKSKNSSSKKIIYDNPEQEFYERMKELQRTKRKNEKLMEEPQYYDFAYFGHKRIPKRHRPGKMKYCKVCGIRH